MLAGRWRSALAGAGSTTVVANADDPLVVWGAGQAPAVAWVAAGLRWRADAVGCPACEGRIRFDGPGGRSAGPSARLVARSGHRRLVVPVRVCPAPTDVWLEDAVDGTTTEVVGVGDRRHQVALALPGRFNQANARDGGRRRPTSLGSTRPGLWRPWPASRGGRPVHHGPGGRRPGPPAPGQEPGRVAELLDLVSPGTGPVVVGINARVADGRGPVVAVGRRLRAPGRAVGGGHRGPVPRPVGPPALRRGRPRHRGRPGAPRWPGPPTPAPAAPVDVHRQLHGVPRPPGPGRRMTGRLRIAVVYPDLLGTYGDGGNGLVLARRAAWRGIDVDLVQAVSDGPLPEADLYALGGGEDGPAGPGGRVPGGRGHPGPGRGRRGGGAGGVRRVPDRRPVVPGGRRPDVLRGRLARRDHGQGHGAPGRGRGGGRARG